MTCKNCKRETHPAYIKKYGGYCLDCMNAGVPEKDDEIASLRAALKPFADYFSEMAAERVTILKDSDFKRALEAYRGDK